MTKAYLVGTGSAPLYSRPIYLLRTEALCVLLVSGGAYDLLFPHHWVMFACLFLVPDLSLLLYLRGPTVAASAIYNLVHSYVLPALLGIVAVRSSNRLLGEMSLIWIAHISLDRVLGFGLKYPRSFQYTHIQSVENPAAANSADYTN